MNEVLASVDRASGKVFKGGCHEVEELANADHTGIRVESRDDGVAVAETCHCGGGVGVVLQARWIRLVDCGVGSLGRQLRRLGAMLCSPVELLSVVAS